MPRQQRQSCATIEETFTSLARSAVRQYRLEAVLLLEAKYLFLFSLLLSNHMTQFVNDRNADDGTCFRVLSPLLV